MSCDFTVLMSQADLLYFSLAELTLVPDKSPLVMPSFGVNLAPDTFLTCAVTPPFNLSARWTLPNGIVIEFGDGSKPRYIVGQGIIMNNISLDTILLIQNITYEDAGTYTCEARNTSDSTTPIVWYGDTVELQLLGTHVFFA